MIPDVGPLGPNGSINGLPPALVAGLFSRDNDSRFVTDATFADRYGWNRSDLAALANGTDLTSADPPPTARAWTRSDFGDLHAGSWDTAVYPEGAETTRKRVDGHPVIRDAHATIFAAQPSTVAHVRNDTERLYLAPNGSLLGLVDYRVTLPRTHIRLGDDGSPPNYTVPPGTRRTTWCLQRTYIRTIRLLQDDDTLVTVGPTGAGATTALDYSLQGDGATTLRLAARIDVILRSRTDRYRCGNTSNTSGQESCEWVEADNNTLVTDVTVDDTLTGTVYDLDASATRVQYPGGDVGIAVFQDHPWRGYTFGDGPGDRVRGVWRFYTARDTDWDVLVTSNASGSERIRSPALPVYVHAFPSQLGPTVGAGSDTELLDRWGETYASPRDNLGDTVNVGTIPDQYTTTWGLAIRTDSVDRDTVTVQGIVAGTNATVRLPNGSPNRRIHNSSIEAEVVRANESAAVVEVSLSDADRGTPIALSEPPGGLPFRDRSTADSRQGYVLVGDRVVETGPDGTVRVVLDRTGVYEIKYVPESWVTANPAYRPTGTTVRWHPVDGFDWWIREAVRLLVFAAPFLLFALAAKRVGKLLSYERH